jgi:hypothetical protein
MVLLSAVVTRSGWKFIDSREDAWAAEQKFKVAKITGKVMASPDHQIPVSADLEAKDKKQAESRKESDNTTSNQQTKEGQATEVVFDLSCAPSIKDTFCPQGDQDISQSQAHVPEAEKASEPNEAKPNERDISRGKWMSNEVTEAS